MAREAANLLLSNPSVLPQDAMNAIAGLALLAVQEGDRPAAKEHYEFLLGKRGTLTSSAKSVDRILGLLSQTMGDVNQSSEHFKDALEFCRKAGYRPELAWSCCDYADMLTERGIDGDRAESESLLDESLTIATELGMRPLIERVRSRLDKLPE